MVDAEVLWPFSKKRCHPQDAFITAVVRRIWRRRNHMQNSLHRRYSLVNDTQYISHTSSQSCRIQVLESVGTRRAVCVQPSHSLLPSTSSQAKVRSFISSGIFDSQRFILWTDRSSFNNLQIGSRINMPERWRGMLCWIRWHFTRTLSMVAMYSSSP